MTKPSTKAIARGIAAAVLGLAAASGSAAESDPEDIIKYRTGVMKSQAGHMAAAAQIVRGKVDFKQDLAYHARALAASMKTVVDLFPPDSDFGVTRALPAVWDKRPDFERAARKAQQAAAGFLAAVDGGDASVLRARFTALGETCKGCHEDFREEQE